MTKSNQPLLADLSDQQRAAILNGADAVQTLGDFKRRSFDLWMTAAKGVAILCEIADRPGMSRKARKNLLKDNGYGSLNDGTVSRLLLMVRHEPAVRTWRDALTQNKRDSWNAPTSICNRCPAIRKAIAEAAAGKPPRAPRKRNRNLELERALDTVGDFLAGTDDADQRAVMLERLSALGATPHGPVPLATLEQIGKAMTMLVRDETIKTAQARMKKLADIVSKGWNEHNRNRASSLPIPQKKAARKGRRVIGHVKGIGPIVMEE